MNNDFLLNSINASNIPTLVGYIISGIFVIIGIIIIFQNNSHKKQPTNKNSDKTNNIDKLINKNPKKDIKTFSPDSIFKILPDFSNKNFFDTTKKELITKLNLTDIEIIKKEIINFKEEKNKYIITSSFKTKENNIEKIHIITSIKNKDNLITTCHTCGGKIKDPTLLRCKHCDSLLPKNKNTSSNEWIITEIK